MKTTLIAILIMLSGTLTANAQMDKQNKKKSMEQKEMIEQRRDKNMNMQGNKRPMMKNRRMMPMHGNMMMQDMPMRRYMMMVNIMPKMQDRLSLTPDQANQLIDLKSDFEKKQVNLKAELSEKNEQLKSLLKSEAPASEVETQLQECAEIRVKMHIAAYETAMKMKGSLTDEQKEKVFQMMDNDNSQEMMNQ